MSTRPCLVQLRQRSPGAALVIALVIALHLALLASLTRSSPPPAQPVPAWSTAIRILAAPAHAPALALPVLPRLLPGLLPVKPGHATAGGTTRPSPAPAAIPALPETPAGTDAGILNPTAANTAAAIPASASAAAHTADDIMLQARRDLSGIDKQLRSERVQGIVAPADTSQRRLDKAFDRAAAAAPGGLFQAPKVEEILDPGGYGRTRYRVVGAMGTYCVTYESNHAPDGVDSMQNGIKPKTRTCPAFEQPPTTQP